MATATNGSGNLSTSGSFYSSGSFGHVTVMSPAGATTTSGVIDYDFGASCTPVTIKVKVADSGDNPLPEGTTIASLNPVKGSMTISPSTIHYTGDPILSGSGGTQHDITITPSGCTGSGSVQSGSFDLNIKSPLGSETYTHFTFEFKAP